MANFENMANFDNMTNLSEAETSGNESEKKTGKKQTPASESKETSTVRKRGRPKKTPEEKVRSKQKPTMPASPPTDYHNSPALNGSGMNLEDGDNNRFLSLNMEIFTLPKIDLYDTRMVQERLTEYFNIYAKYDVKPTVAGMAMALGMNRKTLSAVVNDHATGGFGYTTALPTEVADLIKKAYVMLEILWENYMGSGKINPVSGIFLAKNNFGYVDKQETILTPAAPAADSYSADEIRERYIPSDSPTLQLPDSD